MAILTGGSVLGSESEPVMMEACRELPGIWNRVRGLNGDDGTEGYSGRTWWYMNREVGWLMLSLRGVRLGSRTTYAAPGQVPSIQVKSQCDSRTQI
jgi:hypothetical protein